MKNPISSLLDNLVAFAKALATHEVAGKLFDHVKEEHGSDKDFAANIFGTLVQRFRAVYQKALDDFVESRRQVEIDSWLERQRNELTRFLNICERWERELYMLNVAMPKNEDDQIKVLAPMFKAKNDQERRALLRLAVGDNMPFQYWLEEQIREKLPKAYAEIIKTFGNFQNFFTTTIPQAVIDAWESLDTFAETRVVPALEPHFIRGTTLLLRLQDHINDRH